VVTLINAGISLMAGVLAVLLFRLIYRKGPRELGLGTRKAVGFLLCGALSGGVGICIPWFILLATKTATVTRSPYVDKSAMIAYLLFFTVVAFEEEIIVRGYIMGALRSMRRPWITIVGSSVFFALMHAENDNYNLLAFINITLIGILFALMLVKTGNLWMTIGFHFAWNFVQGTVLGIAVSGMQTSSFLQTRLYGTALLTGGGFGAEASIATTATVLILLLVLVFAYKAPAKRDWSLDLDLDDSLEDEAEVNGKTA
jgi:membrane protease YdiL (CAAX protease family)